MVKDISKEGVFIPSYDGNKNLPATDQITVKYRIPTLVIKNRCRSKPQAKAISSNDGRIEKMEITIEKDELSMLKEMLISISGCSYRCEGKEHSIVSYQDLLNAPLIYEQLYKEIIDEFDNVLNNAGIDQKN